MYGYYALEDGEHVIVMPHSNNYEQALKEQKSIPKISVKHTIDYKTIGQYTGLKDKNGKEIYEGDIIKGTSDDYKKRGIIKFGEYKTITWENAFGTNSPNQYGWYVEYIDKTMVQLCIPNSIEVIRQHSR